MPKGCGSEGLGEPEPVGFPNGAEEPNSAIQELRTARLLLTVKEAAELLSIGRSHLYWSLQRGLIPSVRVGRCRRISTADLVEFVEDLRRRNKVSASR